MNGGGVERWREGEKGERERRRGGASERGGKMERGTDGWRKGEMER
jgi:hypothetical protein